MGRAGPCPHGACCLFGTMYGMYGILMVSDLRIGYLSNRQKMHTYVRPLVVERVGTIPRWVVGAAIGLPSVHYVGTYVSWRVQRSLGNTLVIIRARMHTLGQIWPFPTASSAQGRCIAYACIYMKTRGCTWEVRVQGTKHAQPAGSRIETCPCSQISGLARQRAVGDT